MKYLISSKRSRAVFGIGIVAISIGLISKKINYPARGCIRGTQEITFNLAINLLKYSLILKSSQL